MKKLTLTILQLFGGVYMYKRQSGVLCHISSLQTSFGIGDLGKASFDFIDFLAEAGQSIWQILPINPTSFGDSPYSCFSSFAGNHLFICPHTLVNWNLLSQNDVLHDINFTQNKIDYADVINLKSSFFKKAFKNFNLNKKEFISFIKSNESWLEDYSLFMALKEHFIAKRKLDISHPENLSADYYYGAVWQTWDDNLPARCPLSIKKYKHKLKDEINYHKFLQYIFFKQFALVKAYANSKGVQILGDIPIFVAYDSADCWANQELFLLDELGIPSVVAGVPPDYFSADGQLWGNPLYNWQAHTANGYAWWIDRIKAALQVFDTLRLDHFRGFYSYWAVKYGEETTKHGKWQKAPGKQLFDAIQLKLGKLPIIAEDLGIITPQVQKLLAELDLPGMKVLQFAFDQNPQNPHLPHNFATQNIVAYTGTHDNNTTAGWYNLASELEKDTFRRYLNSSGENASWDLIRACMLSVARISIVPVQDILSLGTNYRTNTPGTLNDNWTFRLDKDQLTKRHANDMAYLTRLSSRM